MVICRRDFSKEIEETCKSNKLEKEPYSLLKLLDLACGINLRELGGFTLCSFMVLLFGTFGAKNLDFWQEFGHIENGNPNSCKAAKHFFQ